MNLRKIALFMVLIVPLLISACNTVDLGSEESAVESFFNAYENNDEDAAKDTICEDYQDDLILPEDLVPNADDVDVDFEFKYHEKDGLVGVYGKLRLRIVNDDRDVELKQHATGDEPLFYVTVEKDGDDWKVCDGAVVSGNILFDTTAEEAPTNSDDD